jgi:hypothetical protein
VCATKGEIPHFPLRNGFASSQKAPKRGNVNEKKQHEKVTHFLRTNTAQKRKFGTATTKGSLYTRDQHFHLELSLFFIDSIDMSLYTLEGMLCFHHAILQ